MMRIHKYQQRVIAICAALLLPLLAHAQIEDVRAAFDGRHLVAYLIAAFLISVFVMMFYNRVYYFREKQVSTDTERLNAQLAMILESSKTQTWTYNVNKQTFTVFSEHGQKETTYIPLDFSAFYDREDFKSLRQIIRDICNWESRFGSLTMKSAPDKDTDGKVHIYNVTVSILRYDNRNKPTVLLGTQQDITEDQEKVEKIGNLALMYHTVFNTSLIDMIFFGPDGVLQEIKEYLDEYYYKDLSIKDLGAMTQFSAPYLNRLFRDRYQLSLLDYLSQLRLSRASAMLKEEPGLSVGRIASAVGFPDQRYFSRCFHKEFGMTPGEYRAKNSETISVDDSPKPAK